MEQHEAKQLSRTPKILGFGEVMLRYTPKNGDGIGQASCCADFMRSVGGDELNVLVALANLGYRTEYITLLPEGPLGEVAFSCARQSNVSLSFTKRIPYPSEYVSNEIIKFKGFRIGTYTLIPEERRVHYQRSNSAFAKQLHNQWDWDSILGKDIGWIHATGITPLLSPNAQKNWEQHLEIAMQRAIPYSIDLNWRPALGTLEKLWKIVQPFVCNSVFLVLSVQSLLGLASILKLDKELLDPCSISNLENHGWSHLIQSVYKAIDTGSNDLGRTLLSVCFKVRNPSGEQKRWSIMCTGESMVSTRDFPVFHVPQDECGGGSAWSAGMIDYLYHARTYGDEINFLRLARHADLFAALCQESVGDMSTVTREEMKAQECSIKLQQAITIGKEKKTLKNCIEILEKACVIGILRAKNPEIAIERGMELVDMGCMALEVTLDSYEYERILKELVNKVGKRCLIGVGTVMHANQVAKVAKLGARFALSPLNPKGMVQECLRYNILPVPAAYTPQEIFDAYQSGAECVKLFPAQLWNPQTLKSVLKVGDLGKVMVIPSGGITTNTAQAWLKSGAFAVGMGSKLVGSDIGIPESRKDELLQAREKWRSHEKPQVQEFFNDLYAQDLKKDV